MVEQVGKKQSVVSVTGPAPTFETTGPKGANVALTGASHLGKIEKDVDDGVGSKIKKGVVAAMLGFTLIGAAVVPAHAQDTTASLPQQAEQGLYLDAASLAQVKYGQAGTKDFNKVLGTVEATQRDTVSATTKAAFDQFNTRITQILQHDAGSLASGLRPMQAGDSLSPTQQKDMERAFKDLLENLPIGAFSPGVQNTLEATLGALGDHRDLSNTTLKQLGKVGGDAAQDLIKELRREHPTTFWSIAGVAAAGAVAVGYTQGTDALEKLGIKPELRTSIFDDTKLSVGVRAGKQFSDPRLTVGLEHTHTFQGGSVMKGGVGAEIHGKNFVSGNVNGSLTTPGGLFVDGKVQFDQKGQPFDARLSARQHFTLDNGQGFVFADGKWSNGQHGTIEQSNLSAGVAATHGRWTTSVSGNYDFKTDTFSSSLSTGRTFDINTKNDLDLQIRGSVDNRGNAFIGAGVTFRF